jgi:RHS repeat-associated protein
LSEVTRPDGQTVTFEYDPLGRRISKRFLHNITRWVWDGDKPLHEWCETTADIPSQQPASLITWIFEANSFAPTAKLTQENSYSIVCDHLGTPFAMYNSQGNLTWQMQLDNYGAVRQGKGQAQDCPFRYQGQYEDVETGLYYNRFRYYSPEEGMYISQDPLGLASGVLNLYSYVSDVNSLIDVYGLYPLWDPITMRWRDSVTGRFQVRPTDLLKTEPGEAFFWSGRTNGIGGADIAEKIARSENGTTLEMLIEKHGIVMPAWDPSNPINTREWTLMPGGYAEGVSGSARGVIGEDLRPGNIWEGEEIKKLKSNPRVTDIVTIDPATQARQTIYTACPKV